MDKTQVICRCEKELTNHIYMIDNQTGKEGYMCLMCARFKPFDDDGEFDAQENAIRELSA